MRVSASSPASWARGSWCCSAGAQRSPPASGAPPRCEARAAGWRLASSSSTCPRWPATATKRFNGCSISASRSGRSRCCWSPRRLPRRPRCRPVALAACSPRRCSWGARREACWARPYTRSRPDMACRAATSSSGWPASSPRRRTRRSWPPRSRSSCPATTESCCHCSSPPCWRPAWRGGCDPIRSTPRS